MRQFFKTVLFLMFGTVMILGSGGSAYAENDAVSSDIAADSTTEAPKPKKENKTVKITISAAGDCTLGIDSRYNSSFNDYYKRKGSAYFLKKVKKVFAKDDVTIVNLEGTFTDATSRADKKFTFKGPAKHAGILTKGSVEVVNTANNHTMDFGKKGYADTVSVLKKKKIAYCNGGTIAYKKVKGVKIAFLGFNALDGVTSKTVKANIKKAKKAGAKLIITSFHWGIERDYYPNERQKELAHSAIRDGADLVLGHHPHVLQGIEQYKGRYIVYSLGNFCFGGNTNPSDKDTMIFQQTFTVKNKKVLKDKNVKVIPCSISSTASSNDFQPRVLTGKSKSRVIKKINRLSDKMGVVLKANGRVK